jgi:predicted flap endonuclease-1-like 5' DNA nuclease
MRIIEIEGIGTAVADRFREAGVRTTEALLKRGATPAGRKELATATGQTPKRVLEWVNRADLLRIRGVGSEFSDLLELAGVDTVKELAQRRADNLHAKMLEVNATKKVVRRPPSLRAVEAWVEEAKSLPAAVTY